MPEEYDLLSIHQVLEIVPVTSITISRWVRDGKFPKPMKMGKGNFWRSDEVDQWLRAKSDSR